MQHREHKMANPGSIEIVKRSFRSIKDVKKGEWARYGTWSKS